MKRVPINHYWELSSFSYNDTHTQDRWHWLHLGFINSPLTKMLFSVVNRCPTIIAKKIREMMYNRVFGHESSIHSTKWFGICGKECSSLELHLEVCLTALGKIVIFSPILFTEDLDMFSINLGSWFLELRTLFFAPRRPSVQAYSPWTNHAQLWRILGTLKYITLNNPPHKDFW